ncbi:hypothetical protein KM043_002317 [Ampulex compressa]|nr:hypothetical protein KM043_002317 [Ampulex compressa]
MRYHDYGEKDNGDQSKESNPVDKEMLVNINCPIGLILRYIQDTVGLQDKCDYDLCDEVNYHLKKIALLDPYTRGTEVLEPGLTYIIIIYERDADGQVTNLSPLVSGKTAKKCIEIISKNLRSGKKTSSANSTLKKGDNTNHSR